MRYDIRRKSANLIGHGHGFDRVLGNKAFSFQGGPCRLHIIKFHG